jgi:hypothetical protein
LGVVGWGPLLGGEMSVKPRKASLRKCINEYCKWCIYDPRGLGLGTWREQTKDCTATDCPLYPVRPVSSKRQKAREEA